MTELIYDRDMSRRQFIEEILRAGAMLGLLMAFSHIFEHYLLIYSGMDLSTASMVYLFEWIVSAGVYVWLMWRSTRRTASLVDKRMGFGFGLGWSYVVIVAMLVGIIVGVANTLFVSLMGYEAYVDGMLVRLDQMRDMMLATGADTANDELFVELREAVQSAEQPSIFSNILASLNSFIFTGGIMGLVIASFARRQPEITTPTEE